MNIVTVCKYDMRKPKYSEHGKARCNLSPLLLNLAMDDINKTYKSGLINCSVELVEAIELKYANDRKIYKELNGIV